jgi:8-oxo-dGTP diphosphatase
MHDRILRVSAYAIICDAGRVLLCRISKQLPHLQGAWTLPGGGLEFGESPEAALVREVKEETGFDVEVGALAKVDSVVGQVDVRPFHGIRILYRANVVGGALTNEISGSTDCCEWHSLDAVSEMNLVELARLGVEIAKSP